ncbi:uncharacterized protein CC84DRAFT_484173 [Paraphaeosphaeria sporulosa]|uniref:Autophagy-related protein 29 n=1 Tax=Paraphaeosphaeria sporulosa TaxID=1460663 RepID=A0A177CTA8_9PLEO|nr:uncharacterized protein CC84DRAFT_484173 [Paraphaeosphaeria sporulosa]OAG10431.1 hypothetical protein CC84DRAFT_484173 [Paraphaeosphaeria sporulosa]
MSGVQFTALIRLPFERGDFVDPQQATWDATKDRELWRIVSKSAKTKDLDCRWLATEFKVPPTFLLQQAAWLYERHLDHVRAQMKKVGGQTAPTSSIPDSTQGRASAATNRPGNGLAGVASRPTSVLTVRQKDDQVAREDASTSVNPGSKPSLSRTPSTNTITQSKAFGQHASVRNSSFRPRQKEDIPRTSHLGAGQAVPQEPARVSGDSSPTDPASSSSSSSLSNSGRENLITRSQLFKRPPRFQRAQPPKELLTYDEDVEEPDYRSQDASAEYPFARPGDQARATGATREGSRDNPAPVGREEKISSMRRNDRPTNTGRIAAPPAPGPETSSSVNSSVSETTNPDARGPEPSSGNHRAVMVQLSPRRLGTRSRKDGSEGTPSMGSSFSDIDDTSISQSALEEALLSNIQHGRMSTLSQLRSRYL